MAPKDKQDLEIAKHFMRSFSAALKKRGLSPKEAEAIAGLSHGTLSHWTSGNRAPSAVRLTEVAVKLGLNAGDIVNEGYELARDAGLLDDVEVIGKGE